MNEEELKEMYKELKRNKKIIGSIDTDFFFEFAETVLNLLEKKDIEYSDLKLKYEQNLRMCKHFREELNKQDKIIDEMAYYLSDFDIDEMCEKCDRCIGNGCYADDDMEFKINCIKKYFERKLENE